MITSLRLGKSTLQRQAIRGFSSYSHLASTIAARVSKVIRTQSFELADIRKTENLMHIPSDTHAKNIVILHTQQVVGKFLKGEVDAGKLHKNKFDEAKTNLTLEVIKDPQITSTINFLNNVLSATK